MSKLKMFILLFVLLSPALAFADCADGKYKDCRCSLAVNNGFQNVSDVTVEYCCKNGCGGMGFNGDSRCCTGADQGKTWNGSACVSGKTPCGSCSRGYFRNRFNYKEDAEAAGYSCCSPCSASTTWVNGTCPYSNYAQQQLLDGETVTYCYDSQTIFGNATTEVGKKIDNWDNSYTVCQGSTGKSCSNSGCDYCMVNGTTYASHWYSLSCVGYSLALPQSDANAICTWANNNGKITSDGYADCYYTCTGLNRKCGSGGSDTTENYRVKCNRVQQYTTMTCSGW